MQNRAGIQPSTIRALQVFLAEMRRQVGQAAYFHLGDLVWRMVYQPNEFDPATDLQIWYGAEGQVEGFVFYLAVEKNPEFFLRPTHYRSPVAEELLAWTIERVQHTTEKAPITALTTSCTDRDVAKVSFLREAGFQRIDEDVLVLLQRDLQKPFPTPQLPPGYTFATQSMQPLLTSVTGNPMTANAYAAIHTAPGYRDDLGIRALHQGLSVAAGAICWFDDIDRSALFEPVGTVAAHRGKGLAFALMAQLLQRLQRYGATVAYVKTAADNFPAIRLYQKLGFQIIDEDHGSRVSLGAE